MFRFAQHDSRNDLDDLCSQQIQQRSESSSVDPRQSFSSRRSRCWSTCSQMAATFIFTMSFITSHVDQRTRRRRRAPAIRLGRRSWPGREHPIGDAVREATSCLALSRFEDQRSRSLAKSEELALTQSPLTLGTRRHNYQSLVQ
jgi:hypothetical protein